MMTSPDRTRGRGEETHAGEEQLVNLVSVSHENQRCDDKRTASCSLMMEGTGGRGEGISLMKSDRVSVNAPSSYS